MIRLRWLLITLFFLPVQVFAQPGKAAWQERLKSMLPLTSPRDKAELLVNIARGYVQSGIVQSDSGYKYARVAYEYSLAHDYQQQACIASELYGRVLLQQSKPNEGLAQYRITRRLAAAANNKRIESVAVRNMGQALWYQGYFKESIDTILLSIALYKQIGNDYGITDATVTISNIYGDMGYYEKAFEYAQQGLKLSHAFNDKGSTVLCLIQIGCLYNNTGDHATAMEYYRRAAAYNIPHVAWPYRYLSVSMGDMYTARQLYDSALYWYRESLNGNANSKISKLRFGNYFLHVKQYDSAKRYYAELYHELKDGGEGHLSVYAGLGMAEVFAHFGRYDSALLYAKEGLALGTERNATVIIRDASRILSSLYEQLQQPGLALHHYKRFVEMKDMVISDQFKGRLSEFRRIAEDEKQRSQILIAEQKLRKNRLLGYFLAGGILILLLLSFVIFRNISLKRKNENLKNKSLQAEWQRTAADLEMQALRARMNPHFIFNCLTSINRFILKNETDKASDYLTRFSRLMRLVLQNSQKQWISLEEEIEMLQLYIGMERLRFMDAFDHSIAYSPELDVSAVKIPPLLLQPFCENAIWHGLMHKDGRGKLEISFEMKGEHLYCTITDNGIGRKRSLLLKQVSEQRHQSMGLRMSTARLALFNEDNGTENSCEVTDLNNEKGECSGTKVILKIRNADALAYLKPIHDESNYHR